MRLAMSRYGVATSVPSRTIRICPPCSVTKIRPLPSRADVTPSGASRPPTTVSSPTTRPAGSNAIATDGAADGGKPEDAEGGGEPEIALALELRLDQPVPPL